MDTKHTPGPLEVVAVVSVNDGEALVLNRPLNLVYERHGNDYVGVDGPFRDALYYQRACSMFRAFAGRELSLPMKDGTIQKVKDHWWQGGIKGYASVVASDVESLKRCYVFSGGLCAAPDELAALRATYTGCVYPYLDYEKVVKYDDTRREFVRRWLHEESRCKALISAIRAKHRELIAAQASQRASVAEGWHFYSADFSTNANQPHVQGNVMLIRDDRGRKWWHNLPEEEREEVALFVTGHGMSFDAAMLDANAKAAIAAAPKQQGGAA
ncbi:hypothetical protein F1_00034 [Ralstonia phage Heva]|uniref:Uncharacterized protein n=1 Tax=Ralstonia phage Heva TaxID=2759730 RepID=A0A7G5BAS4_9CAUD|nr:hypothetical protein KMC48_gp56 [Ralstonia phage Heva]QMV32833.1 hypothetical protein D1_00007 [Ralstonia phage Dimitile]QMV33397.1 hypothetical protein F1_00034 [Ralstonia phage Heva]